MNTQRLVREIGNHDEVRGVLHAPDREEVVIELCNRWNMYVEFNDGFFVWNGAKFPTVDELIIAGIKHSEQQFDKYKRG